MNNLRNFTGKAPSRRLILRTYKSLLSELAYFFDDHVRLVIKTRIRETFKSCKEAEDSISAETYHRQALKALLRIRRANFGEKGPILRLLRYSYGKIGPLKSLYMKQLIDYEASYSDNVFDAIRSKLAIHNDEPLSETRLNQLERLHEEPGLEDAELMRLFFYNEQIQLITRRTEMWKIGKQTASDSRIFLLNFKYFAPSIYYLPYSDLSRPLPKLNPPIRALAAYAKRTVTPTIPPVPIRHKRRRQYHKPNRIRNIYRRHYKDILSKIESPTPRSLVTAVEEKLKILHGHIQGDPPRFRTEMTFRLKGIKTRYRGSRYALVYTKPDGTSKQSLKRLITRCYQDFLKTLVSLKHSPTEKKWSAIAPAKIFRKENVLQPWML
ncbi:hypothetical protein V1514DRAFT_327026 [Lipomyces japonicus]|uniref:uncharacterized protein n=1 Tax=Lipomyces japonicus TaxID=56871 RepID=UPI0034CD1906